MIETLIVETLKKEKHNISKKPNTENVDSKTPMMETLMMVIYVI